MRQLIIFRGPSGSGKTTAAKAYVEMYGGCFFEADSYFELDRGDYWFDATQLGKAHEWCQLRVRKCMEQDLGPAVVSNTSIKKWELKPYIDMAVVFRYEVVIYRMPGPWDALELSKRNVHGLSMEAVQRQINKYEPIEGEQEYV